MLEFVDISSRRLMAGMEDNGSSDYISTAFRIFVLFGDFYELAFSISISQEVSIVNRFRIMFFLVIELSRCFLVTRVASSWFAHGE